MPYDPKQLEIDVNHVMALPGWQDAAKRGDFIREVAVKVRPDLPADEHAQLIGSLWQRADDRGALKKAADFTVRAVEEVVKSGPAMGAAAAFAVTDAVGLSDTGSGTRIQRGAANLIDATGQRVKQLMPGESMQSKRDHALEGLREDLDAGRVPAGFEAWLSGEFDDGSKTPDAETQRWIDALRSDYGRLAVGADHMGEVSKEQLRAWQETDRSPTRADSDIPGVPGPRELLADYVATRDPSSWEAFKSRVTETDAQYRTRLQRWTAEQSQTAETIKDMPEGLNKEMTQRAFDMQGSPIDAASAVLPFLRGAKALQAARAGGMAAAAGRVLKGAGKEAAQEGATEALQDPRATAGQITEAAALGAVGSGMLEGGMAATGAAIRAATGPQSPATGATTPAAPGQSPAPEMGTVTDAGASPANAAGGPSLLAQVATRGGQYDTPLMPDSAPSAADPALIQTDLDAMPETGAELVYDVDGSPMGWVPVQSAASNQQPAVSNRILTPENDPVVAALAALDAARPEGPAASRPAPPVNQPAAAAHAAPLPASTSAAVPGSATTATPAPVPQSADGIRVTSGANALTAPLAPAAALAPVPPGVTSAASAPAALPETAPVANQGSAALPVSPGDTMANASQPPIRAGAENQPSPQAQGAVRKSAPVSLGDTMANASQPPIREGGFSRLDSAPTGASFGNDSDAFDAYDEASRETALVIRAAAQRLGVHQTTVEGRDSIAPAGDAGKAQPLLAVEYSDNGKLKLVIRNDLQRQLWEASGGNASRYLAHLNALLFEESIHEAQLRALRTRWARAGRPGTFRGFVTKEAQGIVYDMQRAAAATPNALPAMQRAAHASYVSYHQPGYTGSPAQLWQEMTTNPLFFEKQTNGVAPFVMEMTRQMIQLQRDGIISEAASASLMRRLKAWIQDFLAALKQAYNAATGGAWGTRMQDMIRETEDLLDHRDTHAQPFVPIGPEGATSTLNARSLNPFHAGDFKRLPNWLKSRLRLPQNAPFRVQNLGLRSILRGSPLPAELLPFAQQSARDIAAVQQTAAQLGRDLNEAITAYAARTGTTLEAAHALVATAMENPAVLNALADGVLKERTRRNRNFLDDLSQAVALHTGGELGKAILQNRGHWMRRSYAAFDPAANWTYDTLEAAAKKGEKINGVDAKKILDDARKVIREQLEAEYNAKVKKGLKPNAVTDGRVKAEMVSLMDRANFENAFTGGSGISKDTSSLIRRQDYHPDMKTFMKQQGLKEWDYQMVTNLAASGRSYQGRTASTLLEAARRHLAARHPKASRAEINDMLRLKDIHPAIRALMGEERNPVKQFITSTGFQAQFIARHAQQQAMRDVGLVSGVFSLEKTDYYTEIVGDTRERSGFKVDVPIQTPSGQTVMVQRPIYATKDTLNALGSSQRAPMNWANPREWIGNAVELLNREAKLNKVALNPDSWIPNGIIGNLMMLISNGDFVTFKGYANLLESFRITGAAKAKSGTKLDATVEAFQDQRRKLLAELTAADVADAGYSVEDLNDTLDSRTLQFVEQDDLWDKLKGAARGAVYGQAAGSSMDMAGRVVGGIAGAVGGFAVGNAKIVGAIRKVAEYVMAKPDRWAKITAFQSNYISLKASGLTDQAAFDLAAEKTRNTMPSYNELPELLRTLSRQGWFGVGPFIAFTYELHRNTFHNVRYMLSELNSGNWALQKRGAARLLGMAALPVIAKYGLSTLFGAIYGTSDDDEEKSLRWRRSLGAPWERYAPLIFSRLDSDKANFVNPSYLMPQLMFGEVIRGAREGRTWEESWHRAVGALSAQWLQFGIANNAVIRAASNDDGRGGRVSNREGLASAADRILYLLNQTLVPGAIEKGNRYIYAEMEVEKNGRSFSHEEENLSFLGLRGKSYDNARRVTGKVGEFRARYEAIKTSAREAFSNNVTSWGKQGAFEDAQARLQALNAEFADWQADLNWLGVPYLPVLKDRGIKPTGFKALEPPR